MRAELRAKVGQVCKPRRHRFRVRFFLAFFELRCDGVLRRFGYLEDQAKAKAKKRLGGGVWVKWSANPVVLT